jgi:hypothetical protein
MVSWVTLPHNRVDFPSKQKVTVPGYKCFLYLTISEWIGPTSHSDFPSYRPGFLLIGYQIIDLGSADEITITSNSSSPKLYCLFKLTQLVLAYLPTYHLLLRCNLKFVWLRDHHYHMGLEAPKLPNLLAFSHRRAITSMCHLKNFYSCLNSYRETWMLSFEDAWSSLESRILGGLLVHCKWKMFAEFVAWRRPASSGLNGMNWLVDFLLPPVFSPPETDHLQMYGSITRPKAIIQCS